MTFSPTEPVRPEMVTSTSGPMETHNDSPVGPTTMPGIISFIL